MSWFLNMGWQHALIGMCLVLGIVCFCCSRWESSYRLPEPDRSCRRNSTEAVP